MTENTFDVIVVGAGPAGITASYLLAKAGQKVVLVERGEFPGSKNVMGGQVYCHPLAEIFPEFWKEAPLERPVCEKKLWLLTNDARIEAAYKNAGFGEPPYNAFTVLRARFDRWLAGKAQEAGALIIPETLVVDVIKEGQNIVGVKTGRDSGELYAPVVVAADGVNSLLAKKAGLHADIKPENVALAVKEIIELPQETLENLFQLEKNQGATIELVGEFMRGMVGTGFIYTNRNSLSVGVGCLVSDWVEYGQSPYDLIEEMKAHPAVRPLLKEGQTREYMAHLIPEGGYRALPPLFTDGMLVVGDAGMLVNGLHQEGSNFAIMSAKCAAETIIGAKERNDYSRKSLALYRKRLDESFVMQDLKKYRNSMGFLENNRHLFTLYPQLLSDAAKEIISVDGVSKGKKRKKIMRKSFSKRSPLSIAGDIFSAWRSMR